jgi:flagellar biosynthesis regulator FlaF
VTDFATWEREILNKFARDAANELNALKEELRVALDAYRKLVVEHAGKTD